MCIRNLRPSKLTWSATNADVYVTEMSLQAWAPPSFKDTVIKPSASSAPALPTETKANFHVDLFSDGGMLLKRLGLVCSVCRHACRAASEADCGMICMQ